ncbi:hypothetical protein [Flavisphingomonas formosensis]|uniref:hypothetical protein n=1 Tax=Flavisphingomonas formosensis TaxID=861534 RepID=UPI0012FB2503|nr:hypothetical protein [Sphingomonas formosensis]
MASGLIPRIGLGVVGIALAALAVSVNLGFQKLSDDDPEAAVGFMPWGAAANAGAAEDALKAQQYDAANFYAARSLDRTLLNVKALRTLALAHAGRNPNDGIVGPGMMLAGQLGWRDTPTQYWLMIAALQAANYPAAMQRADALMRRDQGTDQVLAILRQLANDPDGLHAILDTLETQPNWRQALFQIGATPLSAPEASGMEAIVNALQKTTTPPSRHELWYYLDGLMRARDYDRAYRVWQTSLKGHATGWPYDPHFTAAAVLASQIAGPNADQMPFEWNFKTDQASMPHFGPKGTVILDGNYDLIANFLYQTMHLAPGAHRLAINVSGRKDQLDTLQWKLVCLPARKQRLGMPIMTPAPGATLVNFDFTIPTDDCAYQQLSLTISPPVESGDTSLTINSVAIAG